MLYIMNTFDLEHLQSFVTAVEAGSITAAAPLRCLSQSALSEQLRKLEIRTGQTLLIRTKSGVVPTLAGELLLAHAHALLEMAERAWQDLQGINLSGEVCIGITDYCRPGIIIDVMARLSRLYPHLRLRTRGGTSTDISAAWQRGELDLAIVMRIAGVDNHQEAEREKVLFREPLRWVEAARKTQQDPSVHIPLALLSEGCTLHKVACQTLKSHHRPYVIRHIASGVRSLQEAIIAGLGIGCINLSAVTPSEMSFSTNLGLPELPDAEFVLHSRAFSDVTKLRTCDSFGQILVQMLNQNECVVRTE